METLIGLLLKVAVIGVIFWLMNWAVDTLGVPQPFNKVIKVIIVVVAVLLCIQVLLALLGVQLPAFARW